MNAADQQPLALARRQQVHGGVEPRLAAGEHDDGIGLGRIDRRRHVADLVGKPSEAAGEKRQQGKHEETADTKRKPETPGPCRRRAARKRRWHPSSRSDRVPRVHHPQANPENILWLTLKCGL